MEVEQGSVMRTRGSLDDVTKVHGCPFGLASLRADTREGELLNSRGTRTAAAFLYIIGRFARLLPTFPIRRR